MSFPKGHLTPADLFGLISAQPLLTGLGHTERVSPDEPAAPRPLHWPSVSGGRLPMPDGGSLPLSSLSAKRPCPEVVPGTVLRVASLALPNSLTRTAAITVNLSRPAVYLPSVSPRACELWEGTSHSPFYSALQSSAQAPQRSTGRRSARGCWVDTCVSLNAVMRRKCLDNTTLRSVVCAPPLGTYL